MIAINETNDMILDFLKLHVDIVSLTIAYEGFGYERSSGYAITMIKKRDDGSEWKYGQKISVDTLREAQMNNKLYSIIETMYERICTELEGGQG